MAKRLKSNNMFCRIEDLTNEASVENFFVDRLLAALGYKDAQICLKASLEELSVNRGRKKELFRPDYALKLKSKIRWIVEAKGANESIDDHLGQCEGYCLSLNKRFPTGDNPVQFYLITNGIRTEVYRWDSDMAILSLHFNDFEIRNSKYQELVQLLGAKNILTKATVRVPVETLTLKRHRVEDINAAFAWCHQFIYKKDNLQQSAAFMEFVKLIFLKLLSDREIRAKYPPADEEAAVVAPLKEVRFSKSWIEGMEREHANPLDAIQFQQLLERLEVEISKRKKKRIFDKGERLRLTPETIKGVVERLQSIDLYAVDADLNGRLFETFLNATMRGRDLGQFFTPRSVVKMALELANIAVFPKPEIVLDGCCGTGGFLIDSLAWMWNLVDQNASLTSSQKAKLRDKIATENIYGIDIALDPPLARIARMNMHLHGDGGSRIYQADALDKKLKPSASDSIELADEKDELREIVSNPEGFVDVVITNPPFAKEYQAKFEREKEILSEYELARGQGDGETGRVASVLRSSVMFMERYADVLRPGGRLVTVIDDSILGSPKYRAFRSFLRQKFIVRAVVSLPGDAFQRSNARVKTSILCLQKKSEQDEEQPSVFMYYSTSVGLDDPSRQRVLPQDVMTRQKALKEVEAVRELYQKFLKGDSSVGKYMVSADRVSDRLDVKSCLPKPGRKISFWKRKGFSTASFGDLVELVFPPMPIGQLEPTDESVDEAELVDRELIDPLTSSEEVTFLRVRYDGVAEAGESIPAASTNYRVLRRVRENDLVVSNINAVHGAFAVVPAKLDGLVVSPEYTVCRALKGIDPRLLWMLLRTPESRADLLLSATGIGRTRIVWENLKQLQLPQPKQELANEAVKAILDAERKEAEAAALRESITKKFESHLGMDNDVSRDIIEAFRPPK